MEQLHPQNLNRTQRTRQDEETAVQLKTQGEEKENQFHILIMITLFRNFCFTSVATHLMTFQFSDSWNLPSHTFYKSFFFYCNLNFFKKMY